MKNLMLVVIAVAVIAISANSETQAQMFGFGTFGGVNGYNGNHINYYGGCGVAPDPRLGYCLENDCFCNANNGCFGGYRGNGCNNGCGCGAINRSNRVSSTAMVRTPPRSNRYTRSHRIPRATASAKRPSGAAKAQSAANAAPRVKKVKYRYRY